jgi:hypothetical protein
VLAGEGLATRAPVAARQASQAIAYRVYNECSLRLKPRRATFSGSNTRPAGASQVNG